MTVAGEIKPAAPDGWHSRLRWSVANARAWLALLLRPRFAGSSARRRAWLAPHRLGPSIRLAFMLIVVSMVVIDARTIVAAQGLPLWLVDTFNQLTDFGRAGWILVPIGVVLLAIAASVPPSLSHTSRRVLTVLTVRLGFVFTAVALPGLVVTIVKRMIGRARPFVGGSADPFLYRPFDWTPDYASLPSGHSTNVFAALIAIGLLWPRLRVPMLVYALVIAISRVVVLAHHPSDVIAGAVAGIVGALLVRDWFAARRLGFVIEADGEVRTLPGPSWQRVKQVARQFWRA